MDELFVHDVQNSQHLCELNLVPIWAQVHVRYFHSWSSLKNVRRYSHSCSFVLKMSRYRKFSHRDTGRYIRWRGLQYKHLPGVMARPQHSVMLVFLLMPQAWSACVKHCNVRGKWNSFLLTSVWIIAMQTMKFYSSSKNTNCCITWGETFSLKILPEMFCTTVFSPPLALETECIWLCSLLWRQRGELEWDCCSFLDAICQSNLKLKLICLSLWLQQFRLVCRSFIWIHSSW